MKYDSKIDIKEETLGKSEIIPVTGRWEITWHIK